MPSSDKTRQQAGQLRKEAEDKERQAQKLEADDAQQRLNELEAQRRESERERLRESGQSTTFL